MLDMATMDIIPAVIKYKGDVAKSANASIYSFAVSNSIVAISQKAHSLGENVTGGRCYHDEVLVAMANLRKVVDEMELLTAKEYWPVPSYGDLLFSGENHNVCNGLGSAVAEVVCQNAPVPMKPALLRALITPRFYTKQTFIYAKATEKPSLLL